MATPQTVKTKIQGLIDKANETTGGSDTDLTSAVDNLIAGFCGGNEEVQTCSVTFTNKTGYGNFNGGSIIALDSIYNGERKPLCSFSLATTLKGVIIGSTIIIAPAKMETYKLDLSENLEATTTNGLSYCTAFKVNGEGTVTINKA